MEDTPARLCVGQPPVARLTSSLQVIGRHLWVCICALAGIGPEGSTLRDLVLHACVHCAGYASVGDLGGGGVLIVCTFSQVVCIMFHTVGLC